MKPGKPLGRKTPMPRAGFPRKHHDPALPKHGPSLRARSPKRERQMGIYRHRRLLFLAQHPACESPWPCGQRATEIQHRRGRRGERLLDERWWAASCHDCNQRAESTDTGAAREANWLVDEDFADEPSEKPIIPIRVVSAEPPRAAAPFAGHVFRPDEDGYYCLDCKLPAINRRHLAAS